MSFPLSYKPDGYGVLERLRRLYEDREQDIILALMEIPSPALENMADTHPAGFCEYGQSSPQITAFAEVTTMVLSPSTSREVMSKVVRALALRPHPIRRRGTRPDRGCRAAA